MSGSGSRATPRKRRCRIRGTQKPLADGTAGELLDDIVASYMLNARADTAKAETAADTLRTTLEARTEPLRADEVIAGL